MTYAIIKLGGKQHRVREGERLLVDRVKDDEGSTLSLAPLLVGGNGDTQLTPDGVVVTARVVQHVLGEKIRIGKYKKRTGYRRHTGSRSRLTQIEIETIGSSRSAKTRKAAEPAATEAPKRSPKPKAEPAKRTAAGGKANAETKTESKSTSARAKPKASSSRKDEA
jgi:large subunit ribosomal protein L21